MEKILDQLSNNLNSAVVDFVQDCENPETNYKLATLYENIGQTSAAIGWFLRAAERTTDDNLAYECLLKVGLCFERQTRRNNTVRVFYLHAINLLPKRPEAYFLLARFYEHTNDHPAGYTYAVQGLKNADFNQISLRGNVEYPGKYGLYFQQMVSAWWWGKHQESRDLLVKLKTEYYGMMDDIHTNAVQNNLCRLGISENSFAVLPYTEEDFPKLRFKFAGSSAVKRNYSQVYQDLFVLSMLDGKKYGTYLEIGTAGPEHGNNTKLLEELHWSGIGIEWNKELANSYAAARKNQVLHVDALHTDYDKLLSEISRDGIVDYLQLDCEPAKTTYDIMLKIPFNKYRFAVITYEHDDYVDMTGQYRQLSRDFLTSKGYELIVSDISPDGISNFEDWWVYPELVDTDILIRMKDVSERTKHAKNYMLNGGHLNAPGWFRWGDISKNKWFNALVDDEIFHRRLYEHFFKVEKKDIVVDLGASVGPFPVSIHENKPEKIIAVEAHPRLYETLIYNLGKISTPNTTINKAITDKDGETTIYGLFDENTKESMNEQSVVPSMTFRTLCEENNLDNIDFLKIDIEGSEYDVFTESNFEWITKNIRKIAGEFHMNTPELKEKFRIFRDMYLKYFGNRFRILSTDYVDITKNVWNDDFIEYYSEINIFIDNRIN